MGMDNFERETQNNTMLYGYRNHRIRPEKKDGSIRAMQWCMSVFMLILSAAAIGFGTLNNGIVPSVPEHSGTVPSNRYLESSYATNTDISDAPDVSADINGPQISAADTGHGTSERTGANRAYTAASPSIVNITSFEAGTEYAVTKSGEGSGIIITSDGYIATNSHVIDDSTKTGTMIALSDGSQYLGTIIGIDKKTDLAVVKIDAKDLKAAQFADSSEIYVGQDAFAIGSPGGSKFSNSLTKGTVSALNRVVSGGYVRYIQTDAAINPGNSGGALINSNGQVIGMNTLKLVDTDYEGMGFAIPSNQVIEIVNELIRYGSIKSRGTLGIDGKNCTLYDSKIKNIPQGVIITSIGSDSALFTTPAKENDIITAVNGVTVRDFTELVDELKKFKPGDEVSLTLFRVHEKNSEPPSSFDVTVTLIPDE